MADATFPSQPLSLTMIKLLHKSLGEVRAAFVEYGSLQVSLSQKSNLYAASVFSYGLIFLLTTISFKIEKYALSIYRKRVQKFLIFI